MLSGRRRRRGATVGDSRRGAGASARMGPGLKPNPHKRTLSTSPASTKRTGRERPRHDFGWRRLMGCALMTILILVVAGADWISLILHVPLDLSGQHVCVCGVVPGYDIQRAKPVRQKLYGNVYEIKRAQPVRHKLQDQTVRRIIYGNVYEVNCDRNVMIVADQGNNSTLMHRQKSHKNKGWNGTAKKRVRKWNSLNPSFLIEYHRMLRRARLRWWRFMIQRTPSSNFRARKSETQSVRPHSNPRDEEAEDKIYRLPPPGQATLWYSRN